MTSYQRRCDVITSHRRWYDIILTLCAHWGTTNDMLCSYLVTLFYRLQASKQLQELQNDKWLDRQSRAIIIEFTLYNAPSNLFTSVKLLMDLSSTGGIFTSANMRSTHLFRYISGWDNFVLACEVCHITLFLEFQWKAVIHFCSCNLCICQMCFGHLMCLSLYNLQKLEHLRLVYRG